MYYLKYYLPKQSELFSDPQLYVCETKDELANAIFIAETNGYKIVGQGETR